MSPRTVLGIGRAWLLACAGALAADVPAEMAPQPPLAITQGTSGTWNTAWQGVPGRTYLMQWSEDLANWNYLPLTEAGAGTKAYGGRSSTSKFFVRLFGSDETPDLATTTHWEPPLLRVGGPWSVVTTHKDKSAAGGVRLSLYRWPAVSAAPLTAPLLVATTGADGTYTFDPSALGTDNRIEVRITGSPNQRVYLPWFAGHEAAPGTISPGGDGLTLTGLLGGSGTGQTPDYSYTPGGGSPSAGTLPVFRLEDYLTLDGNGHHVFPLGGQEVQDQYSDFWGIHSDNRPTQTDSINWYRPFYLGWGNVDTDAHLYGDNNYQSQMSVTFGDLALEINVQRNIFILSVPQGGNSSVDTSSDLGSFTKDFKFSTADSSPASLAKRQPAELQGLTGDTPEGAGFNGGQRSKTLEPERRIGVNGLPAPSSPTFVDALTGRFHHSEQDFSLAIPGSDLSLAVERSATDSIWTSAFGLSPTENPLLAFGTGWDTNLSASLVRVRSLLADGSEPAAAEGYPHLLKSNITLRDHRGGAFSFLEYTGGDGVTSYIPDPTMLPERGTTGISLSADTTGTVLTLVQPLLGLTHVFTKTTVDFQIPNNRDTPTTDGQNPSGYTGYQYYRLVSVTDRFGVQLSYQYGDSSPQNLIPQLISVIGRPALQLRIQQSSGRIQAVWDPSGIKHTYTYEDRSLTPLGGGTASSFNLLASHKIGPLTAASYGYQYAIEADPRPAAMLLQTTASSAYTIPTYHIAPASIANGEGDAITINYQPSQVRWTYSTAAGDFYHPAGDPLLVQSIVLPNTMSVAFDLQHTLKNGRTGKLAISDAPAVDLIPPVLSIVTGVTDMWGDHWSYTYATPTSYPWILPDEDAPFLPTASALFFPKLTRCCTEVADSSVEYSYDATAGFELSLTKDAANRRSRATHSEAFTHPASPYLAPLVSASARIHDYCAIPSTTTDVLRHTSTYHYVRGETTRSKNSSRTPSRIPANASSHLTAIRSPARCPSNSYPPRLTHSPKWISHTRMAPPPARSQSPPVRPLRVPTIRNG